MIGYGILLVVIVILIYSVIENRFVKTVRYRILLHSDGTVQRIGNGEVPEDAAEWIRIIQLSDLHGCHYGPDNINLYQKIKSCNPDILIFTGDMITKYKIIPSELISLLERLASEYLCIYSLGNHELKERRKHPERFQAYLEQLQQAGVQLMDDTVREFVLKDRKLMLGACSSTIENYSRTLKPRTKNVYIPQRDCTDVSGSVLLAHDPNFAMEYRKTSYSLVFSGHLHGGIVRIPGWRGVVSTQFKLFPRYAGGYYQLKDKQAMIVSRGLGSHTIKFRLFNRPELVQADIYIFSKSQR